MRRGRAAFALLAVALYAACALWATWPAARHADERYLALAAAGHGEAAAGDHLQLGWSLWLVGHQLERGASPLADPYSFRPEAEATPNVQGWLLGLPFWPLERLWGPVVAYNLLLLLSFVAAGALACAWLRALGLTRAAALAGGAAFALAPYVVGQRTGHLLGLVVFLLPATLLALERRRLVVAALLLAAIPASGQLHLALGTIPLTVGYAYVRCPRHLRGRAALSVLPAVGAGLLVWAAAVRGSIAEGRSFAQVERYSAEVADFVTRGIGADVERLVFVGWLTPLLAALGLVVAWRRQVGLAVLLGAAAIVPAVLALGANAPGYETLWRVLPPLHATRVPERLLPVSALAVAALAALAIDHLVTIGHQRVAQGGVLVAVVAVVAIAVDLRVDVFAAVAADRPNRAYAAVRGEGRLLELPVIPPDVHVGSVYLGYARQSPRERPQGYSTIAEPAAARTARALAPLSCGALPVPARLGVRFVTVHRGVYAQRSLPAACADAAEARLRADGWRLLARDGVVSSWAQGAQAGSGPAQASSAATSSRSRPSTRT